MPPSILVENLRFRYSSEEVLHGLSFEIAPGEVTGLLGPNGAGKSTTIKFLTGILAPGSGRVEVQGFSLPAHARELKQRIGYVPEAAELYETLSAREFLELCGRLHDLEDSSLFPRIDALLDAFELTDHGHSELGSFSKGMRQKVLISAALLHNPDVIFLDEPLTGLDVESEPRGCLPRSDARRKRGAADRAPPERPDDVKTLASFGAGRTLLTAVGVQPRQYQVQSSPCSHSATGRSRRST